MQTCLIVYWEYSASYCSEYKLSEWTIYHEVFTGPWSKDGANKYASFAPKENDIEGIKEYIFKITGSTIEDLSI